MVKVYKPGNIYAVYVLKCPIHGVVRYVGSSAHPKARYQSHIKDAQKGKTEKQRWILWLKAQGKYPIIELIGQYHTPEEGVEAEKRAAIEHIQTIFNLFLPDFYTIITVSDYRKQHGIEFKSLFNADETTAKYNQL